MIAQVLRESAHAATEDAGKMNTAALMASDHDRRRIDVDERAFLDLLIQAYDVEIAQAHASVREGSADQILTAGAMDIDVAPVRIDPRALVDPFLKTRQPENAGEDEVIPVLAKDPVFARVLSIPEYAARGGAVAELLPDPMKTERRFEGVLPVSNAEAGCGAAVSLNNGVICADEERLSLDGHHEKKLSWAGQEPI